MKKSKWKIFPKEKPQFNELVWILSPQLREVLSYYQGFNSGFPIFMKDDKSTHQNHVKYWRQSSDEDKLLMNEPTKKKPKHRKQF